MNPNPWLSVIIPTYQGGEYLAETLESVASQWNSDIEVIVIDDGSNDGTIDILNTYKSKLGLKLLENSRTGNWVKNTNTAFDYARGEYICMLHQDDLWLPTRIERLREAIHRYPQAGFFVNSSRFIDKDGKSLGNWNIPLPPDTSLNSQQVLSHLIVQNFIALPAPVFKRSILQDIGKMHESLWFLADWHLWGAIAAKTETVVLPQILTEYRIHPASQTTRRTNNSADLRCQYQTVINSMAERLNSGPAKTKAIRAAELNTDICIGMALWSHKNRKDAIKEAFRRICLNPAVWHRFLRDSRIRERLTARLRA